MNTYFPTIGIECHVQLKTKTKLFAGVSNDARDAGPNTLVSHICLGMPGALPVLNKRAVELASRAAFALKTKPQKFSKFDRKHYFYPDLPKGYQISQFKYPIILGGEVNIDMDGQAQKIGITRAHLEEDAGKNTHPTGADYSLVDFNRAGTPLLEIVSEPDIHSSKEARAYIRELYLLMKYAGVTEGNLYHGNVRFDVNISVNEDPKKLGNRSEIKNMNSFKAVEKAIDFEIERQTKVLKKGELPKQETRGWDDTKQKTYSLRAKEESHDYRYFPDPDIPPVSLDDTFINSIKADMPVMPNEFRRLLSSFELNKKSIETLIDHQYLLNKLMIEIENDATKSDTKRIADWLINQVLADINDNPNIDVNNPDNFFMHPGHLTKLSRMVEENRINSSSAKRIVSCYYTDFIDPEIIAKNLDLIQDSDKESIAEIVKQVILENKQAVNDIKNGEQKAIGFLVGQVMKESKGKANPGLAQQIIKEKILDE